MNTKVNFFLEAILGLINKLMLAFKYLDIPDHQIVSDKLYHLVLNSLYKNKSPKGYSFLTFRPRTQNQELYDVRLNNEFWNFLDYREVLELIPELKITLDRLNVLPLGMALLVVRQGFGQLHSDISSYGTEMRINWPIVNCETTETKFYKLKSSFSIMKQNPPSNEPEKSFYVYDPKDIEEEIGTYVLAKPIVFRFKTPHSVRVDYKQGTIPRILLSIDFRSSTLKID